jgi:hypothetical protein
MTLGEAGARTVMASFGAPGLPLHRSGGKTMEVLLDALCFAGLIAAQFTGVMYVAR